MFVQMKKILSKLFNAIVGVAKDKLLHFICGLLITQIVIAVVSVIFNPSYGVAIIGLIVGVVAGIIKEIYDNSHEGHYCYFCWCFVWFRTDGCSNPLTWCIPKYSCPLYPSGKEDLFYCRF